MTKKLMVNPHNETFVKLMKDLSKAIYTKDKKLIAKSKIAFSKYDTVIYYNTNSSQIRILVKECIPIDFPLNQFLDVSLKK